MKFKIIITIITLLFFSYGFTQQNSKTISKAYMTLKQYKLIYKKPLTKSDSLSFMVKDNDTLVQVINYIQQEGVSVQYEFKDSIFLKYYKKIAFKHEKNIFSYKTVMKYWKSDIKIYFSNSVSKKVKKEIMSMAKKISKEVDSLNIYQVKTVEESNYIIYYIGDFEYESRMQYYKDSDYYLHWNNKNQLFKSTVRLNGDVFSNDDLKLIKLKELFIKSLGHFNFTDDLGCENYFAKCNSNEKKLTNLDFEILKYHYSYGICKGTDLETFEEQHRSAQRTFELTGKNMYFLHLK